MLRECHPSINTASASQLEKLPGIGPVLAKDIVLYRESSGGFKDIEEIKNVKGIGEKKFEAIKESIQKLPQKTQKL